MRVWSPLKHVYALQTWPTNRLPLYDDPRSTRDHLNNDDFINYKQLNHSST